MRNIIITTSRRPNRRIRSFIKDFELVIPRAIRLARGHLSMKDLYFEALNLNADRVIIVSDRRGNPGIIRIYKPENENLVNIVSFIVKGIALSRERKAPQTTDVDKDKLRLIAKPVSGEKIELEFAEAFRIGLHAQLYYKEDYESIISEIKAINERDVQVKFKYKDKSIGPRIKLGAPHRMIKIKQNPSQRDPAG
ncbi:MAG: hypothetical protein GSR81_03275 [Desulfurococcales archaeon]|nr:hypothetical protein [Desulfurococcales archaeon]